MKRFFDIISNMGLEDIVYFIFSLFVLWFVPYFIAPMYGFINTEGEAIVYILIILPLMFAVSSFTYGIIIKKRNRRPRFAVITAVLPIIITYMIIICEFISTPSKTVFIFDWTFWMEIVYSTAFISAFTLLPAFLAVYAVP